MHNAYADSVIANVPLDGIPSEIAYDPHDHYIYVADGGTSGASPPLNTITVISNTTKIATIQLSAPPVAIAFDPSNNYTYVTASSPSKSFRFNSTTGTYQCTSGCNDNVSVISGTTVIATIPYGSSDPKPIIFNPTNNYIYVGLFDSGSGNTVSVISNTTKIANVTVGYNNPNGPFNTGPFSFVFNPYNNYLYVGVANTDNLAYPWSDVSVISNTTLVAEVPVYTRPLALTYDPYDHYVYSLDAHNNPDPTKACSSIEFCRVSVISNTTNIGNLRVGPNSNSIGLVSGNGYTYAANLRTDTVSVISNVTNVANVTVGNSPYGIVFDPTNNDVYVAQACFTGTSSNTVSVISNTTHIRTVIVGNCPAYLAFNPSNNYVYVANWGSTISVIRPDNLTQTISMAPSGLIANGNRTQIDLSWVAPEYDGGSPIEGYEIERSTDGGSTWSTIVSNTGSTGTTYSDTNVLPGMTYTYRVSAINSIGVSSPSNTASANMLSGTTVPQAPTNLEATATSSSQINLSWQAPSSQGALAVSGYKIERSTDGGSTWNAIVANTGSTGTTYPDTGLTNSTTYSYRVSAINSVGTSSPSNTASATTLP